MRLLEREHVLDSLAEYAQTVRGGEGRLVLVSGEAGVGKSVLLEAFRREMDDAHWAQGACDGLFTPRPLGPLFDIAEQLGGELRDACRAGAARDRLFATLLRQLSAPGAMTVLVVEDAHWADESTLDFLRFLGTRIRYVATLLVVTYRNDGLATADPLRIVIGELATLRSTRRISLSPLSLDAVAVLAGGSGLEPVELYRLTRGNPFFVTEIVAAGSSEIPPSARDAVFARVAPLPGQTRRAVEAAALIGATVEPSLLREVAEATEDDLDRLVAAGLLVSEDATLRFRHEITRLAVEEQIAAHRRGSVHARVLAALLAAGCADDARLAYHAEGAGDVAAVLHFAPRAARRAAEFAAHREAAAQFERALRFAGGADAMAVAELCDLLATEYALIDRFEDAAEVHERAVGLWREVGNQLRAGDTMRQLSRTLWRLCRGQECIAMAEAALSTLEPLGPSRELAWAYAIYAAMVMLDHDVERSIRAGHRALDLAEELDLPDVLSYALNTEAGVVADSDGEWTGMLLRALRVARDAGQVEQAGRAYSNLHTLYINEIRLSEAERCYLEGVTYCDEQDMATYLTCLQGWHATALDLQGRWDEAVAICEPALRIIASPVNRLTSLFALGRIRARRGESSAWECLDEAIENALGTAEDEWISLARLARTESRWLVGDLDAARDEIEGAYEYALRRNAWERGALATWLGRTRSALSVPAEAVAEPYALALAGRFDAAAAAWTRLGCPYQSALALFDSRTEPGLRDALRRFEALGAVAAVRVTRREMRLMGVRSIPTGAQEATRAHRAGLTRREGEVLDLICDGHTNAEISQKLFISERTVGHHVSAVLAKLGVKSRGVAAAEAVRRGLVRGPEK